jgi:hypothetical protein
VRRPDAGDCACTKLVHASTKIVGANSIRCLIPKLPKGEGTV